MHVVHDQLGYTWCWLADPWPLVWCIFSPVTDLYVTVRYPDWTALFSSYCNISKPDVTFFPSVFGFCCIVFGLLASRSCSAVLMWIVNMLSGSNRETICSSDPNTWDLQLHTAGFLAASSGRESSAPLSPHAWRFSCVKHFTFNCCSKEKKTERELNNNDLFT